MVARVRHTEAQRDLVEEALARAAIGERYEVVDGKLVEMTPTGFEHGEIELEIGALLRSYVRERQLGVIVVGEVLFRLDQSGRFARAADVAFVRRERLPSPGQERGAFIGAPDLAVEIVSPNDAAEDVQRKVDDWLRHGTLAVLLVYPESQSVVLWQPDGARAFHAGDHLSLDPVLPDFACKVRDLFPPSVGKPATGGATT